MTIDDLHKSISQLSHDEALRLILKRRNARITFPQRKTKTRQVKQKDKAGARKSLFDMLSNLTPQQKEQLIKELGG